MGNFLSRFHCFSVHGYASYAMQWTRTPLRLKLLGRPKTNDSYRTSIFPKTSLIKWFSAKAHVSRVFFVTFENLQFWKHSFLWVELFSRAPTNAPP